MAPDGIQNVESNCVYRNKVYTVGSYMRRLDFSYNNSSPITFFQTPPSILHGVIFRNDDFINGGFKSLTEDDLVEENEITIYPNPSTGTVFIKGIVDVNQINAFDIIGRSIPFSQTIDYNQVILNFESFKGIAIISVIDKNYRILIQ